MVNHCWAVCDLCKKNAIGELNVWVPVCLRCNKDIDNFFFHENCVDKIFNFYEHKIFQKYKQKLNICCNMCIIEDIGFDFMILNGASTD